MKALSWIVSLLRYAFAPKCGRCRVRITFGRVITDQRGKRWCEECWLEAGS